MIDPKELAALHLTVEKLRVVGKNVCERTGCPPSRMANAFVTAGLTQIVNDVGAERAANWLRGIADQIEEGIDLPSTIN